MNRFDGVEIIALVIVIGLITAICLGHDGTLTKALAGCASAVFLRGLWRGSD